jgi:predicted nucleotidyltransferase
MDMSEYVQRRSQKIGDSDHISMHAIHHIANIIAEKFDPEKIILFGSHAYGDPKPWSDVDLLVVIGTDLAPHEQRLKISRALSPHPFGIDIIVRTPADLERRLVLGDFFLREVINRGKLIYERSNR